MYLSLSIYILRTRKFHIYLYVWKMLYFVSKLDHWLITLHPTCQFFSYYNRIPTHASAIVVTDLMLQMPFFSNKNEHFRPK